MNIYRLIIPVLGLAVLAGLMLLGQLLNAFHTDGLSPTSALITEISSAPLSWGYALSSGLVFLAFVIWLPFKLPEWRILHRYRRVDSAILDNDCKLCIRFYQILLDLRRRYGEARFMQRFASRFNFFYHYHTDALQWLNRLVQHIDADAVPNGMITRSICAGHIGRVFVGGRYRGGLPSAFVKLDEAIYLLAWMDTVEVWSATSHAPICIFDRDTLELETDHRQPHFVSVQLSAREKSSQKHRHLKMHLRDRILHHQRISAQDLLVELQAWLNDLLPATELRSEENFGIDVTEIDESEPPTLSLQDTVTLADLLENLLGSHIDAVFGGRTLSIPDPELAHSTIVLCSGLGIVLVEEIPLGGSIRYSGESQWFQTTTEGTNTISNACLSAQQRKLALNNHLADASLNHWPVHGLVVFSHQDAQPEPMLGYQQVQSDVITLGQLPKWFASQSVDDRIRFTKNDYNELITLLDPARLRKRHARQA